MAKKLSEIKFQAPSSIEEALVLISSEDNARIVAGNTLLNELGKRNLLGEVDTFVDISQLPLRFVDRDSETGEIKIGALSTFTQLLNEPLINNPELIALKQALSYVRPVQVRNAATIGGCIGAGMPFLDVPVALLCLDAKINVLTNSRSGNLLEYSSLCSTLSGGISSGQLITEVRLPSLETGTHSRYTRFSTTGLGEAVVNVAVMIIPDNDFRLKHASIAVGGSGVDMGRMKETEALLAGQKVEPPIIEQAVDSIVEEVQVTSDLNGSADFKKRILATSFQSVLASLGSLGT